MPELPEVETVKRGLEQVLEPGCRILKIEASHKKLRFNSPLKELAQVKGETFLGLGRRAKYLLFELNNYYLLSHLGMTGSWRIEKDSRKHDHIRIHLGDKRILTYHDARRFGFFQVISKSKDLAKHRFFAHLGLDPVVDSEFNGDYIYKKTRNKKTSIKALIMNQNVIVGVGNIYASEALYMAGVHPLKKAYKITKNEAGLLAKSIVDVLEDAIECGGTTISDFKQAGGSSGYFQNFLLAYGRDKESCHFCSTPIRAQAIVGRNSFWCPSCQKL